jgi:hypothetical protein
VCVRAPINVIYKYIHFKRGSSAFSVSEPLSQLELRMELVLLKGFVGSKALM